MRLLISVLLFAGLALPTLTQDDPSTEPLVYLEDGLIYVYESGEIREACRVPSRYDDSPYVEVDNPLEAQVTRRSDMAYHAETGRVVLAVNHIRRFSSAVPPLDDPYIIKTLYLCDLATDALTQISPEMAVPRTHERPAFSPDGSQVAWLASPLEGDGLVMTYDIESGEAEVVYGIIRQASAGYPELVTALIWHDEGIAVRGQSSLCDDRESALVILQGDSATETCLERVVPDGQFAVPVLEWAQADDGAMVVAHTLTGQDARVHYFDPRDGEHYRVDGHLLIAPAAGDATTIMRGNGTPGIQLQAARIGEREYIAALSAGPGTLDGYRNGFAFSPDAATLAMLVSEGVGFARGGTDLYLLLADDTLGALGYFVDAHRIGGERPWGPSRIEAVFWGAHQSVINARSNPVPVDAPERDMG